ncbi:MAG: bifunctional 4-hydroxy-3-methylbut-2-enyl diphosphate reductase/30S ribosomal protein S1 [Oscillospiraceae bacterium]|jgi:4-hydroxy-3-methylbut-2-enyl diphosphate reductase|nr:bifunctional 4-hydroxy-3-methylbut-2-enyl diphosphate reductase/30S ribosomal protein S1 [Oscillospiraceae bacterium]
MTITVAQRAGFCYGVRRAVEMAQELLDGGAQLATLGTLIHNPQVVADLARRGARVIASPADALTGETVLIRAHGISPAVRTELEARGVTVADATCPFVAKIHEIVANEAAQTTLILGDATHPEVQGIMGHCAGECIVYKNEDELDALLRARADEMARTGVVCVQQTTENEKRWENCKKILQKYCKNARVYDTICSATLERQREADALARMCDAMIVIGGAMSANTRQLAMVCAPHCAVFCIESAADLHTLSLPKAGRVGITAGASTPVHTIKEVVSTMSEEILEQNTTAEPTTQEVEAPQDIATETPDVPAEGAVDEAVAEATEVEVAPVPEVTEEAAVTEEVAAPEEAPVAESVEEAPAAEPAEEPKVKREITDDMDFAEALDISLDNGDLTSKTVEGIVTGVTPSEIQVDLVGRKQAGYVPAEEYSSQRSADHTQEVKIGDVLNLVIMKTDDNEGTVMCSKKRFDSVAGWKIITDALENKTVVEGEVAEVVKGGILVYVSGIRVFIPASQASDRRGGGDSLEDLLGQTVKFKILEATSERRFKKVVGSIRAAASESRKERAKKFWDEAKEGDVYVGRIRSLTSFGAFVDLGGLDGLIHITELSWTRIDKPGDVVSVGQEVEVYIKSLDQPRKRISLGYRKEEDSPWGKFLREYAIDDVVTVKVVSLTSFGAFASILPGVEGLIHISQISDERIEKPGDALSIDQEVQVRIIGIDADAKRISLSIRAVNEPDDDYDD